MTVENRLEALKERFEKAIAHQEQLVREMAYKFDDETQEEFEAKIVRRLATICIGMGHANDNPGIRAICPGLDVTWESFLIQRRRVDQLDNIYVSRERS